MEWFTFALAIRDKDMTFISGTAIGEVPEWLKEQFAKLSSGNGCLGSNPSLSATNLEEIQVNSSGRSAVRLAYLLWEQGVAGSNPAAPT